MKCAISKRSIVYLIVYKDFLNLVDNDIREVRANIGKSKNMYIKLWF